MNNTTEQLKMMQIVMNALKDRGFTENEHAISIHEGTPMIVVSNSFTIGIVGESYLVLITSKKLQGDLEDGVSFEKHTRSITFETAGKNIESIIDDFITAYNEYYMPSTPSTRWKVFKDIPEDITNTLLLMAFLFLLCAIFLQVYR